MRRIIWIIVNLLIMFLSAIYDNFFLVLLSVLSIAFLYDNFLNSIIDYKNKRIASKALYKEYCKFQTLTPSTLKIFFKVFFGTHFIVEGLLKINVTNLNQMLTYSLMLIFGVLIIISMIKDVITFNGYNTKSN